MVAVALAYRTRMPRRRRGCKYSASSPIMSAGGASLPAGRRIARAPNLTTSLGQHAISPESGRESFRDFIRSPVWVRFRQVLAFDFPPFYWLKFV